MQFSTWGLTYQTACDLIEALKTAGIRANITAGGIAMYPEPEQVPKLESICKEYNTTPVLGNTLHQERVLNPGKANAWINNAARNQHGVELGLDESL